MRLIPRVFFLGGLLMLVISYQNFSSVSTSDWNDANALKIIHEMQDFEKKDAESNKDLLASPQGGSDFESVKNNWVQNQGKILLNGYDKKIESAMNEKLNSWVEELIQDDPEDAELQAKNSGPSKDAVDQTATRSKKTRQSLRFARVNSLKYNFGENTCVDLTADPGNTRLHFSQNLTQSARVGLEHRTGDAQTQMFLKYEW